MRLVDILARELKVWPEGLECLSQIKGTGYIINGKGFDGRAFDALQIADETLVAGAIVTRAEWQAAVDALKVDLVEYSPAMHAQRVGRVTRVTENPALVDSREQFEQAYSEDNGGLPVSFLMLDRLGDSYGTPKVARAWYWWKRAREAVVVDFPIHDCDPGYNAGVRDCREAIEAAGVKVAV